MEGKVEEEYLKNGKRLQEAIQEWINENRNTLYCILQEKSKELGHK